MTDMQNETIETIELADLFVEDSYSPYALANIVNKVLAASDIKTIPAQMLYNYTGPKQLIKTVNGETGKGRKVSRETAIEWLTKYLAKKSA